MSHAGSLEYTAPYLSISTHSLRTTFAKVRHIFLASQSEQTGLFREGVLKRQALKRKHFRQRVNTGIFRQTVWEEMCLFFYMKACKHALVETENKSMNLKISMTCPL